MLVDMNNIEEVCIINDEDDLSWGQFFKNS
jgi:hypothetical protein